MFDINKFLEERRSLVDSELDQLLPAATIPPTVLHEAMRYSVFSGGKRLRPILCIAAAEAVGSKPDVALRPSTALELLHTYTLVHDDLPCMDDDDMRRGKPSLHKAFGEANAVLAGDALQTFAFEVLSGVDPHGRYSTGDLCRDLAIAAGSMGVVGGQVDDLSTQTSDLTEAHVASVHERKTAVLFRASMRIGAMVADAEPASLEALTGFGMSFGIAFQVTDDILDEASRDRELSCLNFCDIDTARKKAHELVEKAHKCLAGLSGITEPLHSIADFILSRTI